MSKKSFTRQERKTIKKFKSLIARGNNTGRTLDYYAIDEILPPSVYCEIVDVLLSKDTKKREIPLRVKGERENES